MSRKNDPTAWDNTALTFRLGQDGITGVVEGAGISCWRGLDVEFTVSGEFNVQNWNVVIVKQHLGRYTNSVRYSGVINPTERCLAGEYDDGVLSLRKSESESQVVAALSGTWAGMSISNTNDHTRWSNVTLQFLLSSDRRHGTIRGSGVSDWKNQRVEFDVSGDFDWETKQVRLTKQHRGRYTNSVDYVVALNVHNKSMAGEYQNGRMELKLTNSLPSRAPPAPAPAPAPVVESGFRGGGPPPVVAPCGLLLVHFRPDASWNSSRK